MHTKRTLEDLGKDMKIILVIDIREIRWEGVAQDTDNWWTVMTTVMDLRVPK
jgi:hypothetical protein